jgi:hypothetical protein
MERNCFVWRIVPRGSEHAKSSRLSYLRIPQIATSNHQKGIIFQLNTPLSSCLFDWAYGPQTRAVIPS